MGFRILIIDAFEPAFLEALARQPGWEAVYIPGCTRAEAQAAAPLAHVLVLKSKTPLDDAFWRGAIDENPPHARPPAGGGGPCHPMPLRLRHVIRAGAGTEHIDAQALRRRGMRLHHTPGGNANAVAEHAIGMLLSLMNNLGRAHRQLRHGKWPREPNRGHELAGRTMGIVGFGHTGQAVARRLAGFECRILAYDKYNPVKNQGFAVQASLAEIQAEATVLSFHVPLTAETKAYYNEAFQARMAHPHWLLNLARGGVVQLETVLRGLETGKIVGAGLDVLDAEPPEGLPNHLKETYLKILSNPNAVITPHIGGWSYESAENINRMVYDIILKIYQDEFAHRGDL